MTEPAVAGWARWWGARRAPDLIASEIVGPLAIADLVAVRFDHGVLRERRVAGIRPTDDLLALRVILACRRQTRTTAELAHHLGFTPSGIRRAVRVAYDNGALVANGRFRHRTHPAWRPVARRVVAIELKRTHWQRAAEQARAYSEWANAAWLVLGERPPDAAVLALAGYGIGLAYLGENGETQPVLRPKSRRRTSGVASFWAVEQSLVHALASGYDPLAGDVTPNCAMWRGALAAPAH